jgi:hypothetical protein
MTNIVLCLHIPILRYLTLHTEFQNSMKQVEEFLSKVDGLSQDVSLIIADSLYGCMKHPCDRKEDKRDRDQFDEVFKFAKNFGQVFDFKIIALNSFNLQNFLFAARQSYPLDG